MRGAKAVRTKLTRELEASVSQAASIQCEGHPHDNPVQHHFHHLGCRNAAWKLTPISSLYADFEVGDEASAMQDQPSHGPLKKNGCWGTGFQPAAEGRQHACPPNASEDPLGRPSLKASRLESTRRVYWRTDAIRKARRPTPSCSFWRSGRSRVGGTSKCASGRPTWALLDSLRHVRLRENAQCRHLQRIII